MRTTVDLPDEVFRSVKSRAAKKGIKLRDAVLEALTRWLDDPEPRPRSRVSFPLITGTGVITSEQVKRALEEMDEEEARRYASPD
jgi:hypothetical protein